MDLQSRHWQSLYGRREWGWRTTPKFFRQFGVFAYTQAKNERYPLSLYYHIFNLHSNTIIMLKRMKRKVVYNNEKWNTCIGNPISNFRDHSFIRSTSHLPANPDVPHSLVCWQTKTRTMAKPGILCVCNDNGDKIITYFSFLERISAFLS